MDLRILFLGEDWHGSNATSFKRALRFLGCDVLNIDEWDYYPQWKSFQLKVIRRTLIPLIVYEFCNKLIKLSEAISPHLFFVYKGVMVRKSVLLRLKDIGIRLFLFYPDPDLHSFYRHFWNNFDECLCEYDCVFSPQQYHMNYYRNAGVKRFELLPFAYDPWCHYPVNPSDLEKKTYSSDVVFIGSWRKDRAKILEDLVKDGIPFSLSIWGPHWGNLSSKSPLRKYVRNQFVVGENQAKIFASSKIALAFLTHPDLHTARTFEIPAYNAFMLAERTSEHTTLFKEGEEFECFSDVNELRSKINYYLRNDVKRASIALAGSHKIRSGGHSYVDRMRKVLKVYKEY